MLVQVDLVGYSEEDVIAHIAETYYVDVNLVNKFTILIAQSGEGDYEGWSYFLLRDKETGKLYENHASHCSCYGFEGQFEPQETTLTYLKSNYFKNIGVNEEIKAFIETLSD